MDSATQRRLQASRSAFNCPRLNPNLIKNHNTEQLSEYVNNYMERYSSVKKNLKDFSCLNKKDKEAFESFKTMLGKEHIIKVRNIIETGEALETELTQDEKKIIKLLKVLIEPDYVYEPNFRGNIKKRKYKKKKKQSKRKSKKKSKRKSKRKSKKYKRRK